MVDPGLYFDVDTYFTFRSSKVIIPVVSYLVSPYAQLTPWSRVLLEKVAVAHLIKKFPAFYESEGLLMCSQDPTTIKSILVLFIFISRVHLSREHVSEI
jgi:hypothetical protein